jgi:4a-hydroxytetrahydrobiopterin dehydratase
MAKLNQSEVNEHLAALDGWKLDGESITKTFKFKDFSEAWDFMNQVAVIADKELNHHPDWSNAYNQVDIRLTTHDEGGLTGKDFRLAQTANQIASSLD